MSSIVNLDCGIKYEEKSGSDNYRHPHESSDCTVRAFSAAFDIPYKDAHRYMKEFKGRKDGKGIQFVTQFGKNPQTIFWKTMVYHPRPGMTVKTFIKNNPKGSFVLCVPRHVLTVKDGVYIDMAVNHLNSRIKQYYEVKGGNNE